ncbi:hypothetical protein KQI41_12225 [Tissierella pigra]|uniref:hypothetical protein n=1 Tax=Tissierella pigra TaxID=2607614 RepID=UPI001C0FCB82|nr:hypothetical protein [Tissierella pigra]MBU5427183.1 hypothetical protein [Tissierella pigra]
MTYTITTDLVKGYIPYFPYVENNFLITVVNYRGHDNKLNRLQGKLNRRIEELVDLVEETNDYINNIGDRNVCRREVIREIKGK